jgi:hypothetical protein
MKKNFKTLIECAPLIAAACIVGILWFDGAESTVAESNISESVKQETHVELSVKETLAEKNARKSAEMYIKTVPLSYSGLISQLEFDGYSKEEATYGADQCGADWFAEATECAQNYLDTMGMSRTELYNQLEYEGFTDEQIEHALEEVGY